MLNALVRAATRNPVFVNLTFLILVVAGLVKGAGLPKEQFPEVSLDRVAVTTVWPGATATDVVELVTRPIEEALEEVSDVRTVSSASGEGLSQVTVTFNEGTDLVEARSAVEQAVATVDTLPEAADSPAVREVKVQLPVLVLDLTGGRAVRTEAEAIQRSIGRVPGVAGVAITGLAERRIVVALDRARLRSLGIQPAQVAAAIRGARVTLPAGTVKQDGAEIFVKTEQRLTGGQDIASIPLRPGSSLRVGDVAEVRDLREDPDTIFFADGKPGVRLVVSRNQGSDALDVRKRVIALMPELEEALPPGLHLAIGEDYTRVIRDRLNILAMNGAVGALLVALVLWLLTGFRQALLVLWGLPVAYCFAILMMNAFGLSLNVISAFGLIIATGIVVDDAIVVLENVQRHLEMGKDRVRAVLEGTKEVLTPVTVAVATTCFAFAPLALVSGVMGRVMKNLPLVVIFCLIGSLIEVILILPGHLAEYAPKDAHESRAVRLLDRLHRIYRVPLRFAIRHRYVVFGLAQVAFIGTLLLASRMPFESTAPAKPFEIIVEYELAPGTDRDATRAFGEELAVGVGADAGERLTGWSQRVGSTIDQQSGAVTQGANVGSVRFNFEVDRQMLELHPGLVRNLRQKLATDPRLSNHRVVELQAGPPVGAAIVARLRGVDPQRVDEAVARVKEWLRGREGVHTIRDDRGVGKETFAVRVDPDRAALLGLTEADVGRSVRAALDGIVAEELSLEEEPVEVVVRYADTGTLSRSGLGDLVLPAGPGLGVRLDQVADLQRTREVGIVKREEGLHTISVLADVRSGQTTSRAETTALREAWQVELGAAFPDLELVFGGEAEQINESLLDLPGTFLIALGLIYALVAIQFRSYLQPLLILSAVPLGIMGAVLGLFFMGWPLSLFALFGVVALAGVVVNDSLVMVDFINKLRADGTPMRAAVEQGAQARLRPILSTTATTCLGLAPLAFGLGGTDMIIAPMALSISAGLGVSTTLLLVVVPSLYVIFEDVKRFVSRGGRGPDPGDSEQDALQPAA